MKKKYILEQLGFTSNEGLVYNSLIFLGKGSIADIVRKSGLHRPLVYKCVPNLLNKGLISISPKGKSRLFVPTAPDKLETLFKENEEKFFKDIEDLHAIYKGDNKKPIVTYREGKKAIMDGYLDIVNSLPKGATYYRYSSTRVLNREKYVPKNYRETRDRKQLERLIITNEPSKMRSKDKLGRVIKTVPKDYDLFEYDITQVIYGDKVCFADYNTNTIITIENPLIAKFQKKIFKLLFKKLN
jgi:sugar-specific transcriptional regulator TrmB